MQGSGGNWLVYRSYERLFLGRSHLICLRNNQA